MSFYNTGNPVPSIDPRDLDDNAKHVDELVNSTLPTFTDRLGAERRTLAGIEADADAIVLRDELAEPDGAELVGFIQAGAGAVSRTVDSRLKDTRQLHDYLTDAQIADAATGTPTINLTATIQGVLNSLQNGAVLRDDSGCTYLVDTLTISNKVNVTIDVRSTLRCHPGGVGGVTVSNCIRTNVRFGWIFKGTGSAPADYNALTGSAFKVLQSSNCDFEFNRAEGYQYAWHLEDQTGNGVYFNKYRWSSTQYCKTSIFGTVSSGVVGYINANRFQGGSMRSGADAIKFVKGNSQTDPFNGNEFHCDIENATDCIVLDFASNNYFSHRFESGAGGVSGLWVKSAVNCTGNTYRANFFPVDKLDMQGKAETLLGPVYSSSTGVAFGNNGYVSLEGGVLHTNAYRDSASIPTSTAGGQNIKSYVWNTDVGNVSAQDKGVTALSIKDNTGSKKLRYPSDAYVLANNSGAGLPNGTDLPYNVGVVRVKSDTSATDIRLKISDLRVGKSFLIDVNAYVNSIRIRNETDTADIIAAGIVNQVGLWLFYVTDGVTPRVQFLGTGRDTVAINNGDYTTGRNVYVTVFYSQPITNNRTVTLNATNPVKGDVVRVVRSAAATGAFNVAIGATKNLAAGQWGEATYDGSTWQQSAFGSL